MQEDTKDSKKTIGSRDHVIVLNESTQSEEIRQKIEDKIFVLQSRFVQDLKEIQRDNPKLKIEGKISFDLSAIEEICGGVDISVFMKRKK